MANKINIYNSSAIYDSMVKDGFLKADKLSKEKFLNALEYNPKYMPRVRAYAQRVYGMSPEDFDNLVYTPDYSQDVSDLPPSGSSDYVPSMPWDNTPAQFSLPYKTKPGSDNNLPGLPAHDNTSQPNFMRDLSPENVTRSALANAKPQPMQYLPKEEWDKEIRKKEAIQQGLQEIAAHSTRSTTDYSQPITVKSVTHPSDLTLGEWYNSFASDTYSIQKEAGRIYQMWQVGAIDEDEARSRFHQLYVSPQTAQSRSFVRTIDERRNFRRNNAAIDAAEAEITKKLQAAAAQKPTQPIPMPYMGDARISDSIDEQYYKQSLRFLDDARKISRAYADNNYNGTSTAQRVLRGIGDNLITPEAITMGFSAIADNANLMRILEKDERGEQLSDAEETLLSAAIIKQYTEAAYASGTGIAYNIGAVTGESLPYMLSFVVTGIPIKAATSGISKRIVNFVGRQLQRKGIGRAATRATKAALGLGGNIATSALQAPIMPSTYSDYLDRRIGTIDSTTDGMGNISFSHQGDSRSTAALKAYFNTFYENFGERSGEAISSLWGMFGRGIGKIPIGRGKSINDIFDTIHNSRLGKFWDVMQGTAVADFMRQANYDGVFAEVAEEYVSGILNAATIGDQSFEELFSQDNLLTTMGGIALTSVMLGSANATLGVAATQRIRTNFNRSSKAAQQYFSPEQLNQLIAVSGGSVQDITTFLAANIARRQLIARQISQLAARQRNGETGIEAQINTLGAELQDLRMQYDFVNASAMYNAYIGGLSRRIEPMREQARAAIRANGDPATGLTIQVDVNGRQGYLIGGNYNHIQDADGNISVTPTGDLATVLFDGDKTPTPNIPMETISILGVRRTDDVIRDGDRAIFAATEQEENAAQAPATGSTVTVSGSQGNFILQGYDPQGNAIVTPLNTDGTPAVKNGNPITASVPSENIIPEEADNTSSSIRTGSIAYIDGIPYSVDQVDGENAIIHRLNTDGTPVNDEQGNPVTSIVPTATLSSSPHPAQTVEPQNVPDEQQPTTKQPATEQDAAIEETNTQQQPAIVDDNITETPSSALSRIPIDKNGKPIYEQSDPETAYDAILQQADGDTALASRVILSMIDNKEAALNKLSKAKPRRADNPADIIKAEKELAAQIKQAESDLQFWKNTALVPSLRNQAQKEAEANSVIQDPSLADTPDSRTRDNDGSGNHQGIGAIQADVVSTQENSEERLTHEEALAIISDMEKHAEVAPEIELTPENWVKEFGNDGIVNTPIGEVKQGDNQYLKLAQQGRNSKLGMVRPTLERPSIIILDERPAREGKSDRDTSFVFIKTFIKEDGTRYYYFTSVTVSKEGKEVVISSQERSANRISKLLQQGKIAWIDTAFSLHPTTQVEGSVPLNDSNTPTVTDNQPALLGINSSELSQNKDNEKSPISSDLGEKIAAAEAQTETKPSQAQKEDETKHPGTTSSFDDIHPIGHGAFGDIYDQFKGKPQEAIEFLSEKQSGEAIGALHHKDVGDIDLVWGNEGTGHSDGFGLAKLVKYHPEVLNDLQSLIDNMHVVSRNANRINLESKTHKATVRLEWDGVKKNWLLTAFEKENSVRDNTTDTGTTVTGKQNDTATLQNTVSDNKDSDSPSKKQADTTNTQTKKKAEDPKAEKIEDVGEKIGGARKDIIHELTEKARKADSDKSSILDSIRSMPVSKIFNFDYERLRKDGVSNELITLLQVIREIIPSKPRSEYKLRRWTEQVFELYYASLKLITLHDAEQRAFFDKILEINQIDKIYQARMALGGFDSGLNTGKATLEELGENAGHYDKEGNWVSLKGHWYVKNAGKNGGIFPSRKEAEDALRTFAGENASPENSEKKTQFSVYRRNVDGTAFITVKGKPSIIVADGFKNSKEALDYLKTNYTDLDAKYRSMKEKTNIAFRENRPRKGRDWRNGKNISAEEFRETFGFRGVEFGNWTNQEDRQQALNNAFDAFMDLADAIGKSPRSLSLNGQLGIAFGARGGGRAAAHYEPDKVVINLTKTQGAGSLAHEWWHAIDNYFARRRGQQHVYNSDRTGYKYNTEKKGAYSENERQELTDAFKELMNAIDNSSYGKRSRAYASMKSSYWSRPTELGARAFAIWIERKLSERGTVNDFLANNPTSTDWGNHDMVTKYYPYPIEGDFDTLDTAFDNLFNAIQEEVDATTGNTILFHHGDVIGSMTAEQRAAFDAVMSMLKEAGVPVEVLSYEQMRQLADMNGAATRKGTKKTPETDSAPLAEKYQHTAISSADGSKVLKNLETLAENYENSVQTKEKTFIGEVADALNIERTGASSRYATFETKNGQIVTIRLSNHNATVSNFDNASEQEGISIVVSPKKNTGINNDGNAHVVEFYYDAIKLRKADGKPLAQIVRSIQQALYSGEYRDTTGLAVQEEVNGLRARLMTVYHGSGATFEQFDHSHIGEGEGVQAYGWGSYVTEVEDIGRAYAEDLGNKDGSSRNLYTVEIPDDTGNNYLWWEKTLRQKVLRDIARKLEADYGDAIWVPEHLRNMPLESKMRYWMKETYPGNEKTGEAFYNCLSVILGSDRAASEFLSSAGFTGISYPAQYTSGGREDNARNYVIFNEENLKITDHVQFLKDRKGVIYGAAVGGKIYLNASALNPETPIHEYTHLWDEACRRANPELWQRGVELMKQTQLWNEVKNDPNYVNLLSDDEIASEVHARLTGRDGAKLLERMVNEDKENGVIAAANAVSLRERLKKWLSDFWYWLKDSMTPWSREQASKISLSDFVNIPLSDLIKRTNILFRELPDQSTTQEQTNDRFNNELSRQIDGTLPKGHIYDLGMPSDTLLNAGLPNLPIEMAASRLSDKSMQENHPFDLSEIRNLPKAIQSPMAIFRSATRLGSFVVMTEIEHHGRNFVVAIQANRRKGRIEVNDIRSVYPKNNNQIANWVTEGLLEYADKKRMVEWLSKQRSNSAEVRKLFNHATNIIQNFDNPKNNNENIRLREMAAEVADAARPAQVTRQIERLAREMNLPIEIIHSIDDIPDEYTRRYIQGEIDGLPHTIAGYYDRTTGKAYIILPAILQTADPLAEAERTILHEVIAHHGMQALMGRDAYDTLCDEVWNSLPYEARARFAAYVLRKNPRDLTITDIARVAASPALRRAAADEYIAALAEGGVENPTLWQRIKAFFRSILRRMHLYSINPTDADIRYLLSQARENLAQTSTESAKAILQESNDIRFKYTNVDGINMSENAKKALEDGKTDVGKELELAYFIKESGLGTWNGEYHHVGKNYNRHYFVKLNDGVTLPAARKAFKKYLEDKRKAEIKAVLDKYPDAMTRQQVIDAGGRVFPAENRTHKDIAYAGGEYWYIPITIQEQTNDRFNNELQQQIDGTLPEGHIYQLGRPGEILLSAGFPDMPIEMSATRLAEKSQQKNHPFDISAVRDLVKNMNDPIAVFKYGNNAKNVIIGIEYGGKQFLVGVHFTPAQGNNEVSSIRGIFPKDNAKWLNWISQGKADYLNKEEIQALIDKQRTNLADVEYLDLDSVTKIIQNFDNPKPSDPDIRFRELSVPEETIDNASRQGNDYARDARTHAAASIDTHNPDLSPSEQAEAVRFRELLTRDFSAASDFLNSANLINAAMQANDGKAAWLNNIQEAVFDSMLRLRLLLDRMKKDGASIPAGFNPYLAENQSRSRAQNRIAAFNEDYRRPLIESLAKCINKLREENIGVAIKDNNAAHEALSLYAQARAAVERQEVKEREAREQAKADGTEYKHREWAGLPGIQYAIIALYKGEITDDVEANKNNLQWLQDFATENNIPTVEQYITMVEDALQKENIDNLWENIRRISEFQLTTSRDAGILSRGSYQLLTYGYNIDNIIETLYKEQRKKITDDINNGIGDKDTLAANLADLDRRHLEAVATATDLDAPDAITTLVAGGWITQDIANDIHRYYNYYLPLKGHAEITGEDLFDYNTPSMPRNASRIKSVRGHEQLARDPFNQILRDAEGCIVQAERNRWKQQLYHVLSTNRSLANGQYAIQRKYYQVIKLDDGTVRYEPYQRVVTTENNEDIITFVPTSEEIAAGTAVLLNSSAEFDIYVSQKQRSEHETIVYIDGSPISILFYDARIAKAVNGTNEAYPPQWMPRAIIQASRTIPALLTSWHPEFVLLSNPIRDTQEAIANAAIDKGFKYTALLVRNLATVDRDLWAYTGGNLKQKKDNGQPLSQYEKYVTEFFENGGSVNVTQLSDYETTTKDLKKELKRALKGGKKPSKNFWKRLTEQTELRSRIATYITSRQTGSTIQDAINDAKEITVNFDRRGAQFRNFNLLQMFFNAQMQSVRRQTELMRRHPVRYATTVAILASSKVLIGLGISLLLGGGDDDNTTAEDIIRRYFEINKQLRTRNHIFIIDGEVYRIPVAPAFIPFTTLCEEAAQLAFDPSSRHRNTASQALLSVTSSVLETYVPTLISDPANIMININNEQAWRQSFASGIPMSGRALWQPFIEAIYNYDYTGNPIYTEPQFGAQHLPFHRDYRERTGKAYVYTSKLLSDLTGGNNIIPGKINIHPEQIEHVVQGLAGGIGTLAGRFTGIYKRVQGESAESTGLEFLYDIPFAARIYGGNMQQRENRYYQSLFFDDKQALEAFRAQQRYIESSQDMQDFNKEYNRETRKYFYDFATADKLATKVRKWRDAHQKESPEYKQYEAILQDIYRTTDDAFNRLQQSNDNEPYEIIDNPYYIYNNIESQLDKELYNVNGTFMTIDDAARAWAARTRRDKKQYYTLSGDLRQIAKIRDEVKEIKKLFKEIGSDYYPGMPLNGRQQYIYRRIEQKTKALSSLYDETEFDNIQLIE